MSHLDLWQLVALVAALSAYDRLCGWIANGAKRLLLSAILAGVFALILPGPWQSAAWLAVGVFVWRTHAEVRHATWADVPEVFVRHGKYALLGLFPALHFVFHAPLLVTADALIAFAGVAALLARANLMWSGHGFDQNAVVEALRGATLGGAIAVALALI